MRRRKKAGADEANVDMTPMLDVVFILLIFFIVTATFLNEKGFDLTPPPPPPPNVKPKPVPTVNIYIDESNFIRVNGRAVDVSAVRANIEREKAKEPNISVVVQAHPDAKNRFALLAIDQAKQASIENIAFIGSAE